MLAKNTIVLVSFFVLSYNSYSQKNSKFLNNISIQFGLNWVDNSGNQDPLTIFKDYSDIAFNLPFKLEIDYLLNNTFELFLSGISNKFLDNQKLDFLDSNKSYTYFSIDLE